MNSKMGGLRNDDDDDNDNRQINAVVARGKTSALLVQHAFKNISLTYCARRQNELFTFEFLSL